MEETADLNPEGAMLGKVQEAAEKEVKLTGENSLGFVLNRY